MKLTVKVKNVQTDKVTEHKVGLEWGLGCFEIFKDRTGLELIELHNGIIFNDEKVLVNLVYSAVKNWCELLDDPIDVPFSYRQLQNFISIEPQEQIDKILEDYKASIFQGKTMEEFYVNYLTELNRLLEEQNAKAESGKPVKKKAVPRQPKK